MGNADRFYPEAPDLDTDVKNPLLDLFIEDEDLAKRSAETYDSMLHMSRRLSLLDETDPVYEKLTEAMGSSMSSLASEAEERYSSAFARIQELNESGAFGLDRNKVALGVAMVAGVNAAALADQMATPDQVAASTLLTGAAAAGASLGFAAANRDEVKNYIDEFLEIADKVQDAREAFDAAWSSLVEDEDADQLIDDEDAGEI